MNKKIKRVYVDSSAVGGKFNKRLAEQTKPFWDAVERGDIVVIVSDVLVDELKNAPPEKHDKMINHIMEYDIAVFAPTDETVRIADWYISEK